MARLLLLGSAVGAAMSVLFSAQVSSAATLANDAYELTLQNDRSITVTSRSGGASRKFEGKFVVLSAQQDPQVALRVSGLKSPYQVPTWKNSAAKGEKLGKTNTAVIAGDGFDPDVLKGDQDGRVVNCFAAGASVDVSASTATQEKNQIRWAFSPQADFELAAEVELPAGTAQPILRFTFTPRKSGYFSVGYVGAPVAEPSSMDEMWQPLIWQEKRFPDRSYLSAAFHGSIPGTMVTDSGTTVGVIADPKEIPFQPLPTFANSRFGMAVRNTQGKAQPTLFAPILGGAGSQMASSQPFTFAMRLVVRPGGCVDTYEHVARTLYSFKDHRQNAQCSLNQTLENVIDYGLSQYSKFNEDLRGCSYETDVPGSVKNVSAVHPLEAALVTDNPEIYTRRARPIIEYLLSRERFLFVTNPEIKVQNPSWKLLGPCAPASELAALHLISQERNPVLLHYVEAQAAQEKSWTGQLSLYRATGKKEYLDQAVKLADAYLADRVHRKQTELGSFFFWTTFTPPWADLLELYEETGEKRFLEASHAGARAFTQFIWMCPTIPNENVTVNEGGKAPEYWYLKKRGNGPIKIAEETVPAWRLSEIGLTCESSGTSGGHRAIFMANHAPTMLRLAHLTGDTFLHDIARSAIIGRSANFPGYHINTARTTVYEKADYPLREFADLTYNSFHFNHIWPHATNLIDYLVSDTFARSKGAIDFPSRYSEGYAYFKSKIYGDRPGRFYDDQNVRLWLPKGLLTSDNIQLNYIAARGNGKLYLAFTNQSRDAVRSRIQLNPSLVGFQSNREYAVGVWTDNASPTREKMINGKLEIAVAPMGITAITIEGVQIQAKFQDDQRGEKLAADSFAKVKTGDSQAMLLSMGKSYTSAYVYSRATFEELKGVTLHYREGADWKKVDDSAYPFEFTVPLVNEADSFEFQIETTDLAGKTERSESVILRR